ncbi:Ras suppressor protein 1 [Dissostichus eleginoides]|uniref:Ras suppressor protein 1 n=1 Tax=Dissostichus eleginoides TaxID=100907 RepID=A0AAD9BPC8_DISEL|nr:Ras suppressor protein 1 [Dissostichus eleginoides]
MFPVVSVTLSNITQLVLSHNKLTAVPANISELRNLEVLNMFNNQIEELPTQISSLQKLKHLNLGPQNWAVQVLTLRVVI